MRLLYLQGLMVWLVVVEGQDTEAASQVRQYNEQESKGHYKFSYVIDDQSDVEVGDSKNERDEKRTSNIDKNPDMQEVGVNDNHNEPKIVHEEKAEASMPVPTIAQPLTEDSASTNEYLKNRKYRNRQEALYYSKRGGEIETEDTPEIKEKLISVIKHASAEVNIKKDSEQSDNKDLMKKEESNAEETVKGKYSYIEDDGLPATIEYEAGPNTGFLVKAFTKDSSQSKLAENESDKSYDGIGLIKNLPEKTTINEEGTEESYPSGLVKGLYTYTEEDGIPATIEYEAGPKIGFVVKKFSKGDDVQHDQPEQKQGSGTSQAQHTNTLIIIPDRIQEDFSERDSSNISYKIEDTCTESEHEDSLPLSKSTLAQNPYGYQDDDSAGSISITKNQQANTVSKSSSLEPEESTDLDEDNKKEIPMNAAYRFGFSVSDQSRHEEADESGNVHGNYSYVDGAGLLTKVEYEAGAKKGFVIKQMTREHTKTPLKNETTEKHFLQDQNHTRQETKTREENGLKIEGYIDKNKVLIKDPQLQLHFSKPQFPRENSDDKVIFYNDQSYGYENSPYVSNEYVDKRNLPIQYDLDSDGLDKDSNVASGSSKSYSYTHPEPSNFNYDGFYASVNKPPQKYFSESNRDSPKSPYLLFVQEDLTHSNIQKNDVPFAYSRYEESRPESRQPYVLGTEMRPHIIKSNMGYSVYGLPTRNSQEPNFPLDTESRRKGGVQKQKHKKKKIVKRPTSNITSDKNFTNLHPDGSYSFSYRTKDHSREQSVDRNGNIHYSYQIKTKRDGNTLVIFSSQVPPNLVITSNDEST